MTERAGRAWRRCGAWAALGGLLASTRATVVRPQTAAAPFAVIAHPAVSTRDLPFAELRRIFLGERETWPDGTRVVLFVPSPGAPERPFVLRHVYRMDEAAFRRYWIPRTFRGSYAGGPKLVATAAVARRLVAGVAGAVAVVPAVDADGGVRVLRVDGRAPGDAGYRLAAP